MLLLSSSQTSCLLGWARSDIVWQVYRYVRARGDSCKLFTGWSKWIFAWNWRILYAVFFYISLYSYFLDISQIAYMTNTSVSYSKSRWTAVYGCSISATFTTITRDISRQHGSCSRFHVLLYLESTDPSVLESMSETWRTCGGHRNDDFFGIWNVLCGLSREIEPMRRCQICT